MPGANAVIVSDDELLVILDGLADAVQYRWQLAGACPADCMGRGEVCDECADDQDRAERYEHVADQLTAAMFGSTPRGEHTVKVRGELL
jgi:hypothetical protein